MYNIVMVSASAPSADSVALPSSIAASTGYLLARLGTASATSFGQALAPTGLRPRHYAVLSALADGTELSTQHAVGGCLAIDPSTMVSVVDELEAKALIRRRRDPDDRRRYLLRLTAKGRRMHERCRTAAHQVESEVLARLNDEERRTLHVLLQRALDVQME